MNEFGCYVCKGIFPVEFKNEHHKIPKSMGGKDGDNLLSLCAGCHQFLHAVTRILRNPKRSGDLRTHLIRMYPDGASQQRCMELAKLELDSRINKRAEVEADQEREVVIGLKLKTPYRNALQLIARDRKLSMAKYARLIVEDHIRALYPQVGK